MKPFVRAAVATDIEDICQLLHNKMDSKIPLERWRKLMTYEWLDAKPDFGRIVEADGTVLGFCGMVYSDRWLGVTAAERRVERIVSISSWYLDRSLRGMGLGSEMMISSTSDPMKTYTTLTNSPKPLAILEAIGFHVLEDHRYVWRKKSVQSLKLEKLPEVIRNVVPEHEQILLDDMALQPLSPYLLQVDGVDNLLFFSIKRKAEHILWFDLMYASDLNHFCANAQHLADALLPDNNAVLAADGRFVSEPAVDATRELLPVPRYFKSERVAPREVDHLYSELQLLDLKLD